MIIGLQGRGCPKLYYLKRNNNKILLQYKVKKFIFLTPTCTGVVRRHTTQYSAAGQAILGILKEQNCVHFSMVWLTLAHF